MRAHRGQVAVYLAIVLLAVSVLAFTCFNAFLAVRSKNRMMNAVDAAAVTVARYQGYLLNRVGEDNVSHLRDAIRGENRDFWEDVPEDRWDGEDNGMVRMRERVLFAPLKAIAEANAAARDWWTGEAEVDARELSAFLDHVSEIENNPDLYPADGGLWLRYARELRAAVSAATCVLPGYMELARPCATGLFATHSFYDVLAAKAWCWFTVGNNGRYLESGESSSESGLGPVASPENSEVFSLHVTFKTWAESRWGDAFDADWTNFVCQVTGLSPQDFSKRSYVTDPDQVWAFYDDNWGEWSATFNPDRFPIVGSVRPAYDVAGCVASCALVAGLSKMEARDDEVSFLRRMRVTAEAKPLGTVRGLDGEARAPVTAYNRFVASSYPDRQIFTEAQLVLMGAVPRSPGVSMEPGWYEHVLRHGADPSSGCAYCTLWGRWCDPDYRASIRDWLRRNEGSCRPSGPGGEVERGGYEYAH